MVRLSRHAERRCQQRGITNDRLLAFFDHADVDQPARRNCRLIRVSLRCAQALRDGERFASLAAIVDDSGRVVTMLHLARDRRGRRYRRAAR